MSSGVVSRRMQDDALAGRPRSTASSALNTATPVAPPGLAGRPEAMTSRSAVRIHHRVQEGLHVLRVNAQQRFLLVDHALATMSTAMRTAARPVRLPLRVWSI
jgi:hypothetical protein